MEKNCKNCGRPEGSKECKICVTSIDRDSMVTSNPSYWIPQNKNYETDDKMVSHPPHYQTKSGLETIQVIEAFTEGLDGIEAVCTANVIKYICRWKKKNGLQDLKKAQWYLTHLIEHVEKNGITMKSEGLYMNGVDLLKAAEEAIQGHVEVTNLYATKSLEEMKKGE